MKNKKIMRSQEKNTKNYGVKNGKKCYFLKPNSQVTQGITN